MRPPRPYAGTQTVLRAVALLKAFGDERPELGLSDLARLAGLNKTTAFRLLTALESEGMVARSPAGGAYRLGPEVIALGARALRAFDLRAAARPELEALARETGETADVEILVAGEAFVLDEVLGSQVIGASLSVGTHWPAHATSTGKAMLAHLPEAELDSALPRRLSTPTDKTIGSREALKAELARIREHGYATAIEELEANFVAVGAPVFGHAGRVVGAISVGGPRQRLTATRIQELAPKVKAAAQRISAGFGHTARLPESAN